MDKNDSTLARKKATDTIDFATAVAENNENDKPFDGEGLFARDVDGRLLRVKQSTADDFDTDVSLSIDGRPVVVKKAMPLRDSQAQSFAIPTVTRFPDPPQFMMRHRRRLFRAYQISTRFQRYVTRNIYRRWACVAYALLRRPRKHVGEFVVNWSLPACSMFRKG